MSAEDCSHPKPVKSDMSDQGVMAEVTVCPDCNSTLDYRPLREVDVTSSDDELPVYEAEIQAKAKVAKAREVLEESGELDALPLTLAHPSEAEVRASIEGKAALLSSTPTGKQPDEWHKVVEAASVKDVIVLADTGRGLERNRSDKGVVLCSKHGGAIEPCDEGPGKAHHCIHSKWGKLGTFGRPCACYECHRNR